MIRFEFAKQRTDINDSRIMSRSYGISTYQKQKTAMMATRIGFFTFFKLGWSNKVDSTPWRNGFDIGSRELNDEDI